MSIRNRGQQRSTHTRRRRLNPAQPRCPRYRVCVEAPGERHVGVDDGRAHLRVGVSVKDVSVRGVRAEASHAFVRDRPRFDFAEDGDEDAHAGRGPALAA